MVKYIDGLLLTIFSDSGPMPMFNTTDLDETVSTKLGILGMTILNMGNGAFKDRPRFQLHGPIPVPDTVEYETFTITFYVAPHETVDQRIQQHGRVTNLWIIFNSRYRNFLIEAHEAIQEILEAELNQIKSEDDLSKEVIHSVEEKLQKTVSEVSTEAEPVKEPTELDTLEKEHSKVIGFFSVQNNGELISAESETPEQLEKYPVLIIINKMIERIFVVRNKENVNPRKVFLASKEANNINSKRYKNKFQIRDISDPMAKELLFEKLNMLLDI